MFNLFCISLALSLMLYGFSPATQAQPLQPGMTLEVSHEFDNNVFRSENKVSNQAEHLRADVNLDKRSSDYQALVLMSAEHEINSVIEDRNILEGTAQLDVTLLPERVSWTLQDVMSQVRVDPLTPLTPVNSVNTQTLSTGPTWRWQINDRDELNTQVRAERVMYDGGDFIDRDRVQTSAQWQHQLNRLWQAGLGYNWINENLSGRNDIQLNTATVLVQRNSSRMQLAMTLGQTQVQANDDSENIGSVEWRYRLNSNWDLLANFQRSVTSDIDTQQSNGILANPNNTSSTPVTNSNPGNQNLNATDGFNLDNTLSIDEDASLTSEWLWDQRQLSWMIKHRESRNFMNASSASVIANTIDQLQTDQQTLRFYNPVGPRWWWECQLTQQQTITYLASLQEKLDEQLAMTALGYRFNPNFSLTQTLFFQHFDERSQLNSTLSNRNADGFRYLIGLTWTL